MFKQNFYFSHPNFLKLLWCSYGSNMISVHDMKQNRALDPILGARLELDNAPINSWQGDTMLEPIPDSDCIISSVSLLVPKAQQELTNFTVFGILNRPKEVFNFGTIKGYTSDISYNLQRKSAALISVSNKIAYHLLDCLSFEVIKKAKWQTRHKEYINSIDIHPHGERIATMDRNGICLVTDINTDEELFHIQTMKERHTWQNRCRWSPFGSSIAMKFEERKLLLIDSEKGCSIHKDPQELSENTTITWIDWKLDGNYLACGDSRGNLSIFGSREGKMIKKYPKVHEDWIRTVRWSSDGNYLASASDDASVKLISVDFEKIVLSAQTADKD